MAQAALQKGDRGAYAQPFSGVGGDFQPLEPALKGAVLKSKGRAAVIKLPEQPGMYRVFVYVRDEHGGATTANVSVRSA